MAPPFAPPKIPASAGAACAPPAGAAPEADEEPAPPPASAAAAAAAARSTAACRVACSSTSSGNTFAKSFPRITFHASDSDASLRFTPSVVSIDPIVGVVSSMNDSSPTSIVETLQTGFQVSGWNEDMDRHKAVFSAKRPFGVYM